jgi:cobalt-zinc-cadmium efflux system protein
MAHSHHDDADEDYGHTHGPGGHVHAPANYGSAFAIGIGLNSAFVIVEGLFGYVSNSMALVADAGHNLSDVLGLVVAWVAAILSKRAPSARFTYGLRGSSILAALLNAMFLLVAVGAIGWEAIQRLLHPEPVAGVTVIVVAAVGILINGLTAYLFASGRKDDLNIAGRCLSDGSSSPPGGGFRHSAHDLADRNRPGLEVRTRPGACCLIKQALKLSKMKGSLAGR